MREQGVLTLSEDKWSEAKRRTDVIAQLAKLDNVGRSVADEAAAQLGISRRRLYELIRQFRSGSGLVTDLAVNQSKGGKGKARLAAEIDKIITEVVNDLYLSRQKLSEAAVLREISRRCRLAGKRAPARNTLHSRIEKLDPIEVTRKRLGGKAARTLQPAAGIPPEPAHPLDLVQMDHSPMDVIVVEKDSREPIGRPYLTLAIDVFTRSIIGMLLTLEAPSATSVGLCLAHAVTDKAAWLERLGILEASWPMTGKPVLLYVDNGPEFHSEALKRGCEQHGINLDFRPGGLPHFGGIIERVIGSAMTMAHELPGTTFSNTQERGSYDSEAAAIFTLRELEKWLALAICTYHESVHGTLWAPPVAVWKRSIQTTPQFTVSNEKAFLVDFLPVIRRQMNRVGLIIDHITYYTDSFKPWIARRHSLGKFVIRRDPRDLSRVWVLDPESNEYLEVPYRRASNPAVTLWEHRKAVQILKNRGRAEVNEELIFRMISEMQELTQTAAKERKSSRRDKVRREHLSPPPSDSHGEPRQKETVTQDQSTAQGQPAKPFDDIEQW